MANIKSLMALNILLLLSLCAVPAFAEEPAYPQEIIDECAALNVMGQPGCEDEKGGVQSYCFEDKRARDEKDITKRDAYGLQAAEGVYCYAYYEQRPCGSLFQVLKDGMPLGVTCEEMLMAVANKNAECGKCLKKVRPGVPEVEQDEDTQGEEQPEDSPSGEQTENTDSGEQAAGE